MRKPKFSFVMPVYNRELLVEKSIQSCLDQTYSDFELVIVDDCSTDQSYKICQGLAKKDDRIRLFRMKKNGGCGVARHYGNTKAQADIIVIADSDDLSYPKRLEALADMYQQNPNNAVCYTNLDLYIEETGEKQRRFFQPYVRELLYHINFIPNVSSSYKKEAYFSVEGYNKNLRISEDYDLWLQFADKNMGFSYSPLSTVCALKHAGSIRTERQNEHKNFINLVRQRHNITKVSLEEVKQLATQETYDFFSKEEKRQLWFT